MSSFAQFLRTGFAALAYFTRLPIPAWVGHGQEPLARVVLGFPAVGLLLGGLMGLVYLLAAAIWPTPVAVLLTLLAGLALTGALHEDGLADLSDGLGGGWEKGQILAIMKDSRLGSFGAIALWFVLTLRFALLLPLTAAGAGHFILALVAAQGISRGLALGLMVWLDYARPEGDSKARAVTGAGGRLSGWAWALACLPVLPALWALALAPGQPWRVLLGLLLAGLFLFWLTQKLRTWLQGYTGDCLGAAQQGSELAFYLGLLAQWPEWPVLW